MLNIMLKHIHLVPLAAESFGVRSMCTYVETPDVKVLLDAVFGRENFKNEIIWAYDWGGRPKNNWPAKHDNLLWYTMHKNKYTFNYDAMPKTPYLAPGWTDSPRLAPEGRTGTPGACPSFSCCGRYRT